MTEAQKIKIGMDYHGVITAEPDFFARFNRLALERNCLIFVLSGGKAEDIRLDLNRRNVPYSHIWSLADYFERRQTPTHLENGTRRIDDQLWNRAKARYCRRNGIDFYLDDSMLYGQYFQTLFCLYEHEKSRCFLGTTHTSEIDFSQPPSEVLQRILDLIGQIKALTLPTK